LSSPCHVIPQHPLHTCKTTGNIAVLYTGNGRGNKYGKKNKEMVNRKKTGREGGRKEASRGTSRPGWSDTYRFCKMTQFRTNTQPAYTIATFLPGFRNNPSPALGV
jgi:hypothetical protein